MSSILLQKDHGDHKKGETISVPFFIGRALISKGVGVYLNKGTPPDPAKMPKIVTHKAPEKK